MSDNIADCRAAKQDHRQTPDAFSHGFRGLRRSGGLVVKLRIFQIEHVGVWFTCVNAQRRTSRNLLHCLILLSGSSAHAELRCRGGREWTRRLSKSAGLALARISARLRLPKNGGGL